METKYCKCCSNEKAIIEFRIRKEKHISECKDCENKKQRIRNATPERKEYIKEKHQSEKYIEKQNEYRKTEHYKNRLSEYHNSEKHKELRKRYENTEKRKKYQLEYRKQDYVKDRIKNHYNKDDIKIKRKNYFESEKGLSIIKKSKENWLNSDKRMIELLNNQFGIDRNEITPELIELKRITLKTTRLCHQLKS
jgi:hypothetical protein